MPLSYFKIDNFPLNLSFHNEDFNFNIQRNHKNLFENNFTIFNNKNARPLIMALSLIYFIFKETKFS